MINPWWAKYICWEDVPYNVPSVNIALLCVWTFEPNFILACSHSGGWTIAGTPLDLHDPRLLAMAAAERHLLEAEYDEYEDTSASGAAFCRSAALIVSCFNHLLIKSKMS